MSAPRQTASYLIRRFEEAGITPDKRRGQNFLIDLNLLELLASSAELGPNDVVLEVGTGLGSLTTRMAALAAEVVTVEVDPYLQQLASEELGTFPNVTMLRQDALRNKNNIAEPVIDAVRERLNAAPGRQFKLVSNLPYNIATPIVSNLLTTDIVPVSMTVTIQKELGDRIIAKPSTKDYSALSIWMQSQCDAEIVRVMPPTVFWPRPKVHSAIVKIVVDHQRRDQIPDREFFHTFVRALFFHRRKFLRSVVLSAMKNQLTKPEVDAVLEAQGFGPQARAEELDVPTLLRLSEGIREALQKGSGDNLNAN